MPMQSKAIVLAAGACLGTILQGCGGGGGGESPTPAPTPPPGPTTTITTTYINDKIVDPKCPTTEAVTLKKEELTEPIGWNPTGQTYGEGQWCATQCPASDWNLKNYCGGMKTNHGLTGAAAQIKVLSYNLQWWATYSNWPKPGGNTLNPAIGENIVKDDKIQGFGLMGFQECEIIDEVIKVAKEKGLSGNWATYGVHEGKSIGIGIAYNMDMFSEISRGKAYIGEDRHDQYYGRRAAQWVRLTHKASGQTVFYLNHHGPVPVNTGGKCGSMATACNLLKTIAQNAQKGDLIFMTCDCNAWSMYRDSPEKPFTYEEEIGMMASHLPHMFTNPVIGDVWGIDNHFSNCAMPAKKDWTVLTAGTIMGKGGSDHYALSIVYDLPGAGESKEITV